MFALRCLVITTGIQALATVGMAYLSYRGWQMSLANLHVGEEHLKRMKQDTEEAHSTTYNRAYLIGFEDARQKFEGVTRAERKPI